MPDRYPGPRRTEKDLLLYACERADKYRAQFLQEDVSWHMHIRTSSERRRRWEGISRGTLAVITGVRCTHVRQNGLS